MRKPYSIRLVELQHGGRPFKDLVRERRARGLGSRQIGREFGLSHMTVWVHGGYDEPIGDETSDREIVSSPA